MDPMGWTASTIVQLAFHEFVKSSAGEVAKISAGGAINSVKELRRRILGKLYGNQKAKNILEACKKQSISKNELEELARNVDSQMNEDDKFSQEIIRLAQNIIEIQPHHGFGQQNNNRGRDQIIINNPQSDIKIGGS